MFSEPVVNFNNKSNKKLHTNNLLPKKEANFNKEINYKNRVLHSKSTYTTPIISINGYLENYYKNLLKKNSFCDNSIEKNRHCRYCDNFKLPNDNYIREKS
uniref:Uncharacterized protein n=1 Tax=Strongyloides papillosus TaxID=174720 RepID=A0A0N5BHV0_STREA